MAEPKIRRFFSLLLCLLLFCCPLIGRAESVEEATATTFTFVLEAEKQQTNEQVPHTSEEATLPFYGICFVAMALIASKLYQKKQDNRE